jgi:hypothetical protein
MQADGARILSAMPWIKHDERSAAMSHNMDVDRMTRGMAGRARDCRQRGQHPEDQQTRA